jgi:hemolysin activation/secretion protein
VQLFTFFDGGRVWDRTDIPDNALSSTGAGVRLQPISQFSLELQVAKPLSLDSDRSNGQRNPQFLFRAVSWL